MIERNKEPSCAQIISEWYQSYKRIVYSHIKQRTNDVHEQVEDLTSETFARACRSLKGRSDSIENPKKWLLKIADNVVNAAFRSQDKQIDVVLYPRSRTSSYDDEEEAYVQQLVDDGLESEVERQELVNLMLRYLEELPIEQRKAIDLRFMEGLTIPQIADQVHRAKSTVEKDVRTGLAQLRVRLTHMRE